MNPELDRLARARYLSLTTYADDGTAVSVPVWVVSEGGFLQVLSKADDGRVQRVRRDRRVLVAPCDARGELQGDPVTATATIIEAPELVSRVERLYQQRYGVAARIMRSVHRVRRRADNVVIAIEVPPEG